MAGPATPPGIEGVIGRVAKLADKRAVGRLLRRSPQVWGTASVERLTDEVARLVHVDVGQAERLAEAAAWLAERMRDDYCRARAWRAAGHVLFARGNYERALERYQSALGLFEALGKQVESGRTLSSSLQPLIYLGRYQEARARGETARRIFEQAGDRLRIARLDSNLANLFYRQDRFREALRLYQSAYEEFRSQGVPHDVAVALRNMAVCHISLNQFEEALETHRRARDHCETHGLGVLVAEADYNIAYLHYLRGEYTRAIELYQAARKRSQEHGDAYHVALCDLDESELYLELNLIEEGMELAQRAFAGFETLGMRYEAAKALVNLAIGAGRRGEPFRALELLERAREMFAREDNEFWPALIDAYRALLLHQEGRHFEAQRFAESALRFFSQSGLAGRAALCDLVLARVHLRIGEIVSARANCVSALSRMDEADAPDLSYRAHLLLGQVQEALGDRPAAFRQYEAAHARLETLRSHLRQEELKLGFLKDKLAVYEGLVWMILAGQRTTADLETAFGYIEQAKSRSLADLLAFRAHLLPARAAVRSELVAQVHGLRQELNWYYRKIDVAEIGEKVPAERIARLSGRSRERETQLLRVLRDLGATDEEFASLQRGGTTALESIRSTLPPQASIVEYYEARDTILASVLSRDRLEILPLTPTSRVRHLWRLLQFQLSKFRLGSDYVNAFADGLRDAALAHLRELHGELFAPLRGLLDAKHLIVVPHGFLHYIPFHALFDGEAFVVDEFAVSYAPSGSVHHLCSTKQAVHRDESLIMGLPSPAAPHIRDEVEAVAATLPNPRVFVGEAATEENLRRHGPQSRFVHIATHGFFRHDNPMFSAVQLAGSRLSLFDLYDLELPAELVTLSGCSTGLSVTAGGDELLGLVRGLLYAGSQAAVVTLWDVNDRSTAEFMERFYRHLQAGSHKALAMRQAMRELREKYHHPYFWAPFVLVGKATPS